MARAGIEPGISRMIAGYPFHCAIMTHWVKPCSVHFLSQAPGLILNFDLLEMKQMVVMRNLSLNVVTGMKGPGATSEMAGQGVEVMIAGLEMKGLLRVAGMDTGRTETGEVTLEVVMTKEAAMNAVVVLMREKGGQEVQTQDVMEVGLA